MTVRRGTIKAFKGSWNSGMGTLVIEDSETGETDNVLCDNGPTVRALDRCFGDSIGDGHTVKKQAGFIDKEIHWAYDDMGLCLEGFAPVEEM